MKKFTGEKSPVVVTGRFNEPRGTIRLDKRYVIANFRILCRLNPQFINQ